MKVIILAGYAQSLLNFRGDLIKAMIAAGHDVTAIAPENDYKTQIEEIGAKFIQISFNRAGVNPLNDLKLSSDLKKIIVKEEADVFFGYTIKPVIYGSLAAKRAGIQNRYAMITGLGSTFIGSGFKNSVLKIISKILYKYSLKSCSKVIFQNGDDLSDFTSMGILKKEKCEIVNGSGVNMDKYEKSPVPQKPVFLLVARLLRDKGIFEYLEAAELVKKARPEAEFHLVGPFDTNPTSLKQEDLQKYIDNGTIIYHGSTDDVRPFIKACSVYVLPSYREGTPRTVLEAMAMGRAVITSDAPGCRQTVKDGVTGLLTPVRNTQLLAEKMFWMIKNPESRVLMGEAGYEYCLAKYEVGKVNEVMLSIMGLNKIK